MADDGGISLDYCPFCEIELGNRDLPNHLPEDCENAPRSADPEKHLSP